MSADTNARDHARSFYYWQSSIRLHEEMEEATAPLRDLAELQRATEALIEQEVLDLRANNKTWAQIADALGGTRQGAQRKYGRLIQP